MVSNVLETDQEELIKLLKSFKTKYAVTDGKPASMAGLLRGDVIVNFHGEQIHNIEDYSAVLSKFAKGDKTTVTVKRGADTLIREISF